MLSSPIILEDYPRIAPESPGDLFDGGEIDQLLVLNILTLTDEEKAEMRDSDPRAREILERTEALSHEELMRLHGAIREFGMARAVSTPLGAARAAARREAWRSAASRCGRGSRVRLRPRAGARRLRPRAGRKVAVVERIEEDLEGGVHLAVVLEDDPGATSARRASPGTASSSRPTRSSRWTPAGERAASARVLVAGIGNVFLGDDGFGVELARRLARARCPRGVEVVDFGIRGMDLAYALRRTTTRRVLLDAVPRGEARARST